MQPTELNGRRILHIMSPSEWINTKYNHVKDANYKVMRKTITWLPNCHHYILVPESNTINDFNESNQTVWKFHYPYSVIQNRGEFDGRGLRKLFDVRMLDFDFVFLHQPELLYNVEQALRTARVGENVSFMTFNHWFETPQNVLRDGVRDCFRQMESYTASNKVFFHSANGFREWTENFAKMGFMTLNPQWFVDNDKLAWMPLSPELKPTTARQEFDLPNKKILVFNSRWSGAYGINELIEYTEGLDRDEYLVWVTDSDAKSPKMGQPAPSWMHVQSVPGGRYPYLLSKCHATLSFRNGFTPWSIAAQDAIVFDKPSLVYRQATMPYVLGEDYPLFFKTKTEFVSLLSQIDGEPFKWKLPPHDVEFKKNLYDAMIQHIPRVKQEIEGGREWVYLMTQGLSYKKDLLANTHKTLPASNQWNRIRLWLLQNGVTDNPTSEYTRFSVDPKVAKELLKGYTPQTKDVLRDTKRLVSKTDFWE